MAAPQLNKTKKVFGTMSGKMEGQLPENGDALLAAEYVLGVQSAEIRLELSKRMDTDPEFARLVAEWEYQLSDLNASYEPLSPPFAVKQSIDAALFSDSNNVSSGFWNSLKLWRGIAIGALAMSAAIILPLVFRESPENDMQPLVAALQSDTGEIRFLALYEIGSESIRLSKIKSEKATDRDYELWLIEADGTPQSMGVIADRNKQFVSLTAEFIAKINSGDTFAISIEPLGGSPTGKVTGPVIAVGQSNEI